MVSKAPFRALSPSLRSPVYMNRIASVQLLASILMLTLLVIFADAFRESFSLAATCNVATIIVAAVVTMSVRVSRFRLWSVASVYLVTLGVFHFGLTFIYGVGRLDTTTEAMAGQWFFHQDTREAIFLACVAFVSCGIAVQASHLNHRPQLVQDDEPAVEPRDQVLRNYLSIIGSMSVLIAIALWLSVVIQSGGLGLAFGSYQAYLSATAPYPVVEFVWLFMGLGLCFVVTGEKSRLQRIAIGSFLAWAIVVLPLGLRGEVLFTSVAALVILARRGRAPSAGITLVMAVVVLFSISLLREVRDVGITNVFSENVSGGALSGLGELGSSLHPVSKAVQWHAEGDAFIRGASYWAPIDRALCTVSGSTQCLPADQDDRIMNVLVLNRYDPIGFSPVAEAYRNFGPVGVSIVFLIIGGIVGVLSRLRRSALADALISVFLVELLIYVRNTFVAIPAHIAVGLALVVVAVVLSRSSRFELNEPEATSNRMSLPSNSRLLSNADSARYSADRGNR